MSALDEFLAACVHEIGRRVPLASWKQPQFAAGHRALVDALADAAPVGGDRLTVPVAAWMDQLDDSALAALAGAAAGELSWVASSRLDGDDGSEAGLAPINDLRDLGDVIVGLMLLRPGGVYPLHSHPPQEVYLPICGDGEWRYGGSDEFRRLDDDALVYNHPNDVHSVVAGDEPLLALYVLWGDGVEALR